MMSQPWSLSCRATSTASSGVRPPSDQSVAEMRTDIGLCRRPDSAHRVEDLERKAHAVLQRPAVLVAAEVGERRDEAREQVAVRHVDLQHVEAGRFGHAGRAHELVAHAVHVGAVHLPGHLAVREVRQRRGGDQRPVALGQRLVVALPQSSRGAFAPGVAELQGDLGPGVRVDEIHDALPGRHVLGLVHARAPGGDAAFAADVGHLGDDQRPRRRWRGEPRCTRCQSSGVPSSAEYWHIGETTTRFVSSSSRSRKGVNMGGGAGCAATAARLWSAARPANHRSTVSTNSASRSSDSRA